MEIVCTSLNVCTVSHSQTLVPVGWCTADHWCVSGWVCLHRTVLLPQFNHQDSHHLLCLYCGCSLLQVSQSTSEMLFTNNISLSLSLSPSLPPPPSLPPSHRLIGFGMMWLYRKNKYTVIDIHGLSVDKWRERQRTKQANKTRAGHSRTSSVTASVHYSSTGDSVVIGLDNSNQQ